MRSKANNIFFLFGLAAVVVMILTFDVSFDEMWRQMTYAGAWLFPIIGMWVVIYLLNTLTWWVIIRGSGECGISFPRLFKITISGFALNYATPCGLMGGEPYKILEAAPYIGRDRAASSVVLFAMTHIFSHFWYWLTAVVLALALIPLDTTLYIVLPLMALFCCGGIYLFTRGYKSGLVLKTFRLLVRLPGLRRWGSEQIERHRAELERIDMQIAHLHSQEKRNFYRSFALEYVGRICHSFEIFFMLRLVGIEGSGPMLFLYAFLILAFTSLFANLLFFMPLQLGGREGGFAMSCVKVLGTLVTSSQAVTIAVFISIICRVREIFWTAVGLLLIKLWKS